ncbi:MAG: cell division protein ZapB [Proteobacteria bacterium]|uniref:cell division protein ZapB n=1 Tax=Aquabacterium sp. TaxID=1872578 RepID=UPI0035C77773|nr:cell division protein ZapB [Pseudomonadota bacterium]
MSRIDELTDRIERLLLRHEELRRTNDLLAQQVTVITQERDSLRARLAAARGRIEALLDKLPMPADQDGAAADGFDDTPPTPDA